MRHLITVYVDPHRKQRNKRGSRFNKLYKMWEKEDKSIVIICVAMIAVWLLYIVSDLWPIASLPETISCCSFLKLLVFGWTSLTLAD